jgi:hypothetical protein
LNETGEKIEEHIGGVHITQNILKILEQYS